MLTQQLYDIFLNRSSTWDKLNLQAISGKGWIPGRVSERISEYFDSRLDGHNLDLCCGYYPHVRGSFGLDISSIALKRLAKEGKRHGRAYVGMQQFDLDDLAGRDLPFPDDHFSSATMICGWNYIQAIDELIYEVERVIRPKGWFFVVQFRDCGCLEDYSVRKEGVADIVHTLSLYGYRPAVERICLYTKAVVAEID